VSGAAQSGTPACPVLISGVADASGNGPLIRGVNPSGDLGFGVAADDVTVDGFEISDTLYGLYGDVGHSRITFSNNVINTGDLAYGVLLSSTINSTVLQNRIEATTTNATAGVWDVGGRGNIIDGNRVRGFGTVNGGGMGIWLFGVQGATVQGNISARNYQGITLSSSTGTLSLYNNTVDGNFFFGVYAESPQTVISRNNSITNNGIGWGWNGIGTVDSNFDNVWNNVAQYTYRGTVTAGPRNLNANPLYLQNGNPLLPTYYRLGVGSPNIDAGTAANGGLPFLGLAPDIGAVETQ
jgi:parallel beta-helix repeat protein